LALVSDWLAHFQRPVRYRVRGEQDVRDKKTNSRQGDLSKTRIA
jgi:hypothetical protein